MKLYYARGACSLSVRIIIHEIGGIQCDFESVNLQQKKTETHTDFLKINSKGMVPVLVLDNQEILTENVVILIYLADLYKAESILPAIGDFKRYRVLEWLNYISSELHKNFSQLRIRNIPEPIREDAFIKPLRRKLSWIAEQLGNKKYLLGDEFTLADSYLFVVLSWMPRFFHLDLAQWPALKRYYNTVMQRKAVEQSLREEGLLEKS